MTHLVVQERQDKTCFNGLYRENRKGLFNVPFGKRKNPTICDEENLKKVSLSLQDVKLLSMDFEELTDYIDEKTFVYMDPPYRPLNATSNFNDYSKEPFNDVLNSTLFHPKIRSKAQIILTSYVSKG